MAAIQFVSVCKSFRDGRKKTAALNDLSLSVEQGEIFGFLGPNGAGKSTSIKLLMNFIRPDQGRIQVKGLTVGTDSFQHHIGYLPETPCFFENLTGAEILWFAGRTSGMTPEAVRDKSAEVLNKLKLDHAARQKIRTYSKGMKQRLGLAAALVHDPDIYILDEPMSGLDPMGRKLITDVILQLREKGKTVFFSSHILSDIERLCDRIGILNKGKLLYVGNVAEIVHEKDGMEETFIRMIENDEVGR